MNSNHKRIIIILAVLVVSFGAFAGYSYNKAFVLGEKNAELERRLSVLQDQSNSNASYVAKIEELQKKVDYFTAEKNNMVPALNLANSVAKSLISANLDKLEPLFDESLIILKEGGKIYLVKDGKLKEKAMLYDSAQRLQLREASLSGYEKLDDTSYFVELKQLFNNERGEKYSQVAYLDLKVIEKEGKLKVMDAKMTFKKE